MSLKLYMRMVRDEAQNPDGPEGGGGGALDSQEPIDNSQPAESSEEQAASAEEAEEIAKVTAEETGKPVPKKSDVSGQQPAPDPVAPKKETPASPKPNSQAPIANSQPAPAPQPVKSKGFELDYAKALGEEIASKADAVLQGEDGKPLLDDKGQPWSLGMWMKEFPEFNAAVRTMLGLAFGTIAPKQAEHFDGRYGSMLQDYEKQKEKREISEACSELADLESAKAAGLDASKMLKIIESDAFYQWASKSPARVAMLNEGEAEDRVALIAQFAAANPGLAGGTNARPAATGADALRQQRSNLHRTSIRPGTQGGPQSAAEALADEEERAKQEAIEEEEAEKRRR